MQVVYSPRAPRSPRDGAMERSHAPPTDPFGDDLSRPDRTRMALPRWGHTPQVTDLRRPSIDVLMMPSGPAPPPTHVAEVELGDPLSPRSAELTGRLSPVAEAAALAPEPEVSGSSTTASKQDRWAGGIVEGDGVYTGWMLKKGETGNGWKRRYFACSLASKTLSYYDKPGGALPSLLPGVALTPPRNVDAVSCVCVPGKNRATLDLSACHDLVEITQDSEPRHVFQLQFQAASYLLAACVALSASASPAAQGDASALCGSGPG